MVLTNEWIEKNIDGVKRSIFFFRFQYAKVTRDKLVISGGHVIQNNWQNLILRNTQEQWCSNYF